MGWKRYELFLFIGITFLAVWCGILKKCIENNAVQQLSAPTLYAIIVYLPAWAILSVGLYGIGSIGMGVMNFRDVPDAAAEIEIQIRDATVEMTRRGVIKGKDD
jgi:hypothetical protein